MGSKPAEEIEIWFDLPYNIRPSSHSHSTGILIKAVRKIFSLLMKLISSSLKGDFFISPACNILVQFPGNYLLN
jgi:hypothetical protein